MNKTSLANTSTDKTITNVISLLAGGIFTLGLITAQMIDPNKIVAFLRIFDRWDPSLALVMGAAVTVAMPAFILAKRWQAVDKPALNQANIELPSTTKITPSLLVGSMMFGIGWGMIGFCPAPALVAALAGYTQAMIFVIAMVVGFAIHAVVQKSH